MDPIILFFLFGIIAGVLKCQIKFSAPISELLTILLLLTIGLKGGMELYGQNLFDLLPTVLMVSSLGLIIPMIAFPILNKVGHISLVDSASLAAHYGSVSVGTFAVCIAFLNAHNVSFEPYVPLFIIILEVPAIVVGLIIAKRESKNTHFPSLFKETLRSKAVVLLLGGMIIGWIAGPEKLTPYNTLFVDLFYGVLALFLVEMGFTVTEKLGEVRRHGAFIIGFGIGMPMLSGTIAMAMGYAMGLSMGGTLILTILGASSSYIAVPAAMRLSLPEANLSLSLGSSLGVTFPFNVLVGIPLFYQLVQIIYKV